MNTEEEINQLKLEINKLKSNLRDLTIKFKELKSQSQSPTLSAKEQLISSTANVTNTNVNNNTTQKIPNIQRYRGASTPYKQDITDDELYALAEAL